MDYFISLSWSVPDHKMLLWRCTDISLDSIIEFNPNNTDLENHRKSCYCRLNLGVSTDLPDNSDYTIYVSRNFFNLTIITHNTLSFCWSRCYFFSLQLCRWNTKRWKQEIPSCLKCSNKERVSLQHCTVQSVYAFLKVIGFVFEISPSVKDKAEILLQVEELLHIKEELSSQVCYGEVTMMRHIR